MRMLLILYSTPDNSITAVQTIINISEKRAGMLNHIKWINITEYRKTVLSFPCQTAPGTSPDFLIVIILIATASVSLNVIITRGNNIFGNLVTRQKSTAICVSLSDIGSNAFPKLLTILNLRAIIPSAISVIPDIRRTIVAGM